MIDPDQLRDLIIIPSLRECGLHSPSAVNLILGTCAVESDMGSYIAQINGPALSPWMIEPETHLDIYLNFLTYNYVIRRRILNYCGYTEMPANKALTSNLSYACLMSRLVYYRQAEKLPESDDINGLALYWKKYYNTENGKGTVEDFIDKYNKYLK